MKTFTLHAVFILVLAGSGILASNVVAGTSSSQMQNDYLQRKGVASQFEGVTGDTVYSVDIGPMQNDYLQRKGMGWTIEKGRAYHLSPFARERADVSPASNMTRIQNDYILRKGLKF